MTEFLQLISPADALNHLMENLPTRPVSEVVETIDALGRVTTDPVIAPYPLPSFPRSTVDGYVVRATDTYGASESLPIYLHLIGEIPMGEPSGFELLPGQCALIHTGGMLPKAADAVVMIEHTQSLQATEVEISRAVAIGENVLKMGEDVITGQVVIPAGTRLRPPEIGGLAALGIMQLQVARRPRVGILSSGDEIVPPGTDIQPGQVRDVNSYALSALVVEAGGEPVRYGIIPDKADLLLSMASLALVESDLVVITAGSSMSTRDLTATVINSLGKPGVLVHGVNIRPGKPTILAVCNGKVVIGLPGNPVSALVIAKLFVVPVVESLLGLQQVRLHPSKRARLSVNLPSQAGREDWIPVRLIDTPNGYEAVPIFGKSNLIFTLVRADGLVCISPDATGLSAGTIVDVTLI